MSDVDDAIRAALVAAGVTVGDVLDPALRLLEDLGVDSLGLLDVVEALQHRFEVVVPDEDVGRLVTVGDLVRVVTLTKPDMMRQPKPPSECVEP